MPRARRSVSSGDVPRVSEIVIRIGVAVSDQCSKNAILVRRLVRVVPPMLLRTLPVHRFLGNKAAAEHQLTIIGRCKRFGDGPAEEQGNTDFAALGARLNHAHTLSDSNVWNQRKVSETPDNRRHQPTTYDERRAADEAK